MPHPWLRPLSPAIVLAIAFVVLTRFVRRTPVIPRELSLDRSLTARAPEGLIALSQAIDVQHWIFVVLAVAAGLLLARRFRQALLLLLAEPLAEALSLGLKVLIDRQMPNQAVQISFAELDALLFPSGHVVRVTVTVGLLVAFVAWPHGRLRWPATLGGLAFIGLVGVTQTTVGGHLPLDVVGGALLGGVIVNVVYVAERAWARRLNPPEPPRALPSPRSLAVVQYRPRYARAWPALAIALAVMVTLVGLRAPQRLTHLIPEPHPRAWAHALTGH